MSVSTGARRPSSKANSKAPAKVFISYSHEDSDWLERLQKQLKPLERAGLLDVWDDTRIETGDIWSEEIGNALESAKVAVLLVSADYLASDYIATVELPLILAAAAARVTALIPVVVRASLYNHSVLKGFQSFNPPTAPLSTLEEGTQDERLVELAETILSEIERPRPRSVSASERKKKDVLECTLRACWRAGLYPRTENITTFAGKPCRDLLVKTRQSGKIRPPYSSSLLMFRKSIRFCLSKKKYKNFKIYLQRLHDPGITWEEFCAYHAERLS